MTTPSALILSSATSTIQKTDKNGRLLTIKRITALDRLRLLKAAGPELSQNDAWLGMAVLALAVTEIGGTPRIMPVNERQIEAVIAELGDNGLLAIVEALDDDPGTDFLFSGSPEGNAEGTPILSNACT